MLETPIKFVAQTAGALSYALRIPRQSAATAHPADEEAPMLNALQEFQRRLGNVAARLDAQYDAAQQFAASVDAERQYVRGVADELETFIMANATELVNEAFTRLQTDESKVQEQQKTIDDQAKQITDLQARSVDQATLDKIDTLLHPPAPVTDTPPADDGTAAPVPPATPPAAPNA